MHSFHSQFLKYSSIIIILTWNIFALVHINQLVLANGLEISDISTGHPILLYEGKPLIAYGPSPQNILTYLPEGNGNNISDWVEWAKTFKIKNVRSYPPSFIVKEPSQNVFHKSVIDQDKFDLNLFNQAYFNELRNACLLLKQHGIIVHLQLWQAVHWKKMWHRSYYNPKNNVNSDISTHAGPGKFVTLKNKVLLNHQKKYVLKILDATGDLGNVFYDIMNEIGNGTGKSKDWVWEIINTVNQWEIDNSRNVLLTLNDEGGLRMGNFTLVCRGLDLIVKDLGRYDEHLEAQAYYGKPTLSVRNIDYDYISKKRLYFYGRYNLEINEDQNLQTRGRKYWWRMFMSKVQIAAGYADSYTRNNKFASKFGWNRHTQLEGKPTYHLNQISEQNYLYFKNFSDQISNYEKLEPLRNVLSGHPIANSYCLQSKKQAIVYLESPNGKAGFSYVQKEARLTHLLLDNGKRPGKFYFPATGHTKDFFINVKDGAGILLIPAFKDDLAITIQ